VSPPEDNPVTMRVLIVAAPERAAALHQALRMVFPRANVTAMDFAAAAEESIPEADAAIIDAEAVRGAADAIRVLRARDFRGAIVVVTSSPDDETLRAAAQSLGARCIARSTASASPAELGAELIADLGADIAVTADVAYARRVFAAGQATLSLQHAINNPLAGLLAEAQLLQQEDLTREQRESADRMVDLCRRVVALVRRLDALGAR
jgi:signal transduction histidine kinase